MSLLSRMRIKWNRYSSERRLPSGPTVGGETFPSQPSCQIPHLGSILESVFGKQSDGTFVEIGAYDGLSFSNSFGLAHAGWKGHYFEPITEFAQLCRANYSMYENVSVHEFAITSDSCQLELVVKGTLTTASIKQAEEYASVAWAQGERNGGVRRVQGISLNEALSRFEVQPGFEVLVVDVEGHEEEVFSGFDLALWKPRMLIIELADLHPDLTVSATSHAKLRSKILSHGYEVLYRDHINTVFALAGHQ